ncbi:MAG: SdpI family protein [Lachnospiraceae bacterium]|nr:SdpI family protein [Lachnospiraceae bacterium]
MVWMILSLFLIPVLLGVIGLIFKKKPVKTINNKVGYRSKRSMASQESWDFAQKKMSDYCLIAALITLIPAAIACFYVKNKTLETAGIAVAVIMALQTVVIVLVIPFVEKKLKDEFGDK